MARTPRTGNINIPLLYMVTSMCSCNRPHFAMPNVRRKTPVSSFQVLKFPPFFNLFKLGPTLHGPCIPPHLFVFSDTLHLARQTPLPLSSEGCRFCAGFEFQRCTSVPLERARLKCRGTSCMCVYVYATGSCVPISIRGRVCMTLITPGCSHGCLAEWNV